MKRKYLVLALIIVLIALVASVFNTPRSNKIIKVGVILPLSGQYASLGESDRNAMLLAKEELGAKNIEFIFEDDKYDAKTAVTAYQKLKSVDHINALVVLSAPSIQSLRPLVEKDDIILFGLGETLSHEKDNVIQLMPSVDLMKTLGEEAGKRFDNIAVVHINASLFTLNAQNFIKGLGTSATSTTYVLNPATTYRTDIQKILKENHDATTVFLTKQDAITFLKELKVLDSRGKLKIICDFGVEIAPMEYTEAIGKERLEGCISTNMPDTKTKEFVSSFKKKFNQDPLLTADYAYDSVVIINSLTQKDIREWRNILLDSNFSIEGASGVIHIDPIGDRGSVPPAINIYRNGIFIPAN